MINPLLGERVFSDRARRCSDIVTQALTDLGPQLWGKWIAIRLSDGGSDGNIYDAKSTAQRFQLHPKQCAYVCVPPEGMSPRQAETYLRFIEGLYDAGADLADPDTHIPMPQDPKNARRVIRAVKRGTGR